MIRIKSTDREGELKTLADEKRQAEKRLAVAPEDGRTALLKQLKAIERDISRNTAILGENAN